MKQVGKTVEEFLRRANLWQGYRQHLLMVNWGDIVGPALTAVTRPAAINHGVLKVAVKNSVWAYHLSTMKPTLIKKLNQFSGSKLVKDIIFCIDDQTIIYKN